MIDNNAKKAAVAAYITIIGSLVGFFMNFDHKHPFANFHLRQAIGLHLTFYLISFFISGFDSILISSAFYLFYIILLIYGLMNALNHKTIPLPLVGNFYEKTLKSIIGD